MRQIRKVINATYAGVDIAVDGVAPYTVGWKVKLQWNIHINIELLA